MERPDLDTLACVNPECRVFRQPRQGNRIIWQVYGHDHLQLLRWHTCWEEFSERRGTALFNTKLPEAKAVDVGRHLDEGCSVRATVRLVQVSKETVARLWIVMLGLDGVCIYLIVTARRPPQTLGA